MAKRFRIAFSFAGEKRDFVSKVADTLAKRFGENGILYDKFHAAEFANADLAFDLPALYKNNSDLIVAVFCPDYEHKEWCGLEWRAIFSIIKEGGAKQVMLSRFDHAEGKGLYGLGGFIELDRCSPEQFATLILERLALNEGNPKDQYTKPAPTSSPPLKTSIPTRTFHHRAVKRFAWIALAAAVILGIAAIFLHHGTVPMQDVATRSPRQIKPPPQPMPVIPASQDTPANQQVGMSQKPFENFTPNPQDSNTLAQIMNRQAAQDATAQAADTERRRKWHRETWKSQAPYFRQALVDLRDELLREIHLSGKPDHIAPPSESESLPNDLDDQIGEFKVARIKMQNNTNMDFEVSLSNWTLDGGRQLTISCTAGRLDVSTWTGSNDLNVECKIHLNYPGFNHSEHTNSNNANELILEFVKELVEAQAQMKPSP